MSLAKRIPVRYLTTVHENSFTNHYSPSRHRLRRLRGEHLDEPRPTLARLLARRVRLLHRPEFEQPELDLNLDERRDADEAVRVAPVRRGGDHDGFDVPADGTCSVTCNQPQHALPAAVMTPNQSSRRGSSARGDIAVGPDVFRLARYVEVDFDLHRLVRHVHGFDGTSCPATSTTKLFASESSLCAEHQHHALPPCLRRLWFRLFRTRRSSWRPQNTFFPSTGMRRTAAPLLRKKTCQRSRAGEPVGSKKRTTFKKPPMGSGAPRYLPAFESG